MRRLRHLTLFASLWINLLPTPQAQARFTNPQLAALNYTNDVAGRVVSVTDPLLRTSRIGYDADGRTRFTTNAAQEVTQQEWNARGEATKSIDGAGHTISSVYDETGNQVVLTNRNGKKWQFQFDGANRLTNTITPLVEAPDIKSLLHELGQLHGRTSHGWNGEQQTRGRKVFFRAVERAMRSDRHYFATLNYVHHNPVRHGYAERWTDWRWSSATEYLAQTGIEEAKRVWQQYPLRDYGKGWDEPEM